MPISMKEYNSEPDSIEKMILAQLEKQPYQAYSLTDLTTKVENLVLGILQAWAVISILDRLIKKGLVKSKIVKGITHYVSSKAV